MTKLTSLIKRRRTWIVSKVVFSIVLTRILIWMKQPLEPVGDWDFRCYNISQIVPILLSLTVVCFGALKTFWEDKVVVTLVRSKRLCISGWMNNETRFLSLTKRVIIKLWDVQWRWEWLCRKLYIICTSNWITCIFYYFSICYFFKCFVNNHVGMQRKGNLSHYSIQTVFIAAER